MMWFCSLIFYLFIELIFCVQCEKPYGCICDGAGFFRDDKGKCIPLAQCPRTPTGV